METGHLFALWSRSSSVVYSWMYSRTTALGALNQPASFHKTAYNANMACYGTC